MFRPSVTLRGLFWLANGVRPALATRTFRQSADGVELPSPSGKGIVKSAAPLNKGNKKEYEEIVEQVRVMNEYFSQYVEEYYEEADSEEIDGEEEAAMQRPTKEECLKALAELYERRLSLPPIGTITADDVVGVLRQQRVKNIVCLRMPTTDAATLNEHIVICETHNSRHAHSVIINVRKYIKANFRFTNGSTLPQRVRNGPMPQWFNMDLRSVMLHILTPKARARYHLEALYGADENDSTSDDHFQPIGTALGANIDRDLLPPPKISMAG